MRITYNPTNQPSPSSHAHHVAHVTPQLTHMQRWRYGTWVHALQHCWPHRLMHSLYVHMQHVSHPLPPAGPATSAGSPTVHVLVQVHCASTTVHALPWARIPHLSPCTKSDSTHPLCFGCNPLSSSCVNSRTAHIANQRTRTLYPPANAPNQGRQPTCTWPTVHHLCAPGTSPSPTASPPLLPVCPAGRKQVPRVRLRPAAPPPLLHAMSARPLAGAGCPRCGSRALLHMRLSGNQPREVPLVHLRPAVRQQAAHLWAPAGVDGAHGEGVRGPSVPAQPLDPVVAPCM